MGAQAQQRTFVLIPGAGGMGWYWHRVAPLLEQAKQEAITIDLPGDDISAGLQQYAEIVIQAFGERSNAILVCQSLGAFTAALVCTRLAVDMIVFVNAMIPNPGETAGAWWQNTGAVEARVAAAKARGYTAEFNMSTYFLHDVPEAVLRTGPPRAREQTETVFSERCGFAHWPKVPIHVIASAADRFFPLEFQRRVARERLKTDIDVIPGGHLVALSNSEALVDRLLCFAVPDATQQGDIT